MRSPVHQASPGFDFAVYPPFLRLAAWLFALLPFLLAAATVEISDGNSVRGDIAWQADGALAIKSTDGKNVAVPAKGWRRVSFGRPKIFDLPGLDAGALGDVSPEYVAGLPPGVLTTDGSFVAGAVTTGDDSAFAFRGGAFSLSRLRVGVVLFQHVTPKRLSALAAGRRGVLLRNGDFVDGEFHSFTNGVLKVSSVLFGIRSLNATFEVAALAVRPVVPITTEFEVRLQDGSVVLARSLQFTGGQVQFQELAWQRLKLSPENLSEIRRPKTGAGFDAGKLLSPPVKFAQFQRDRARFADEAVARFEMANAVKTKEARQTAETTERAEAERLAKDHADSARAARAEIEGFGRAQMEVEARVKANLVALRETRFPLERAESEHRLRLRLLTEAQGLHDRSTNAAAAAVKFHEELKARAETLARDAIEKTKAARLAADAAKAAADKSVAEVNAQVKKTADDAIALEPQLAKATTAKTVADPVVKTARMKADRVAADTAAKTLATKSAREAGEVALTAAIAAVQKGRTALASAEMMFTAATDRAAKATAVLTAAEKTLAEAKAAAAKATADATRTTAEKATAKQLADAATAMLTAREQALAATKLTSTQTITAAEKARDTAEKAHAAAATTAGKAAADVTEKTRLLANARAATKPVVELVKAAETALATATTAKTAADAAQKLARTAADAVGADSTAKIRQAGAALETATQAAATGTMAAQKARRDLTVAETATTTTADLAMKATVALAAADKAAKEAKAGADKTAAEVVRASADKVLAKKTADTAVASLNEKEKALVTAKAAAEQAWMEGEKLRAEAEKFFAMAAAAAGKAGADVTDLTRRLGELRAQSRQLVVTLAMTTARASRERTAADATFAHQKGVAEREAMAMATRATIHGTERASTEALAKTRRATLEQAELAVQQASKKLQLEQAVVVATQARVDADVAAAAAQEKALAEWRAQAERGAPDARYQLGLALLGDPKATTKYVDAYVWFALAGKRGVKPAADLRVKLAEVMTEDQLGDARRRVANAESKGE